MSVDVRANEVPMGGVDAPDRWRPRGIVRLSLSKPEAAACLGISTDSFERYVQPQLKVIRRGRLRLFPMAELERWIAENAETPLQRPDGSRRH